MIQDVDNNYLQLHSNFHGCSAIGTHVVASWRPRLGGCNVPRPARRRPDGDRCRPAARRAPFEIALNLIRHHWQPSSISIRWSSEGNMQREYDLDQDVILSGARCRTLASATHTLRQTGVRNECRLTAPVTMARLNYEGGPVGCQTPAGAPRL
jgi:hypothetical protein